MRLDGQMVHHPFKIELSHSVISGVVISKQGAASNRMEGGGRRLLLLHGAGVAGDLTWRFVANYLQHWDEILIPDLPAMGASQFNSSVDFQQAFKDGRAFNLYLDSIQELLGYFNWREFSLAGYSFGGLISHHLLSAYQVRSLALIEPASLLSSSTPHLHTRGQIYQGLGKKILKKPEDKKGFLNFLAAVSPQGKTNTATDDIAVERLMMSPEGLAYGVLAVGQALQANSLDYINWKSDIPGCSFVGGLSGDAMKARHEQLAAESDRWQFHLIPDTDHGLIYTRPRQIARLMDESLHLGWK